MINFYRLWALWLYKKLWGIAKVEKTTVMEVDVTRGEGSAAGEGKSCFKERCIHGALYRVYLCIVYS